MSCVPDERLPLVARRLALRAPGFKQQIQVGHLRANLRRTPPGKLDAP